MPCCIFSQMWVNIVEGIHKDPSCADVFEHIVSTLCQLRDRDAVWTFAPWTLQTNQEVHILYVHGRKRAKYKLLTLTHAPFYIIHKYSAKHIILTYNLDTIMAAREHQISQYDTTSLIQ